MFWECWCCGTTLFCIIECMGFSLYSFYIVKIGRYEVLYLTFDIFKSKFVVFCGHHIYTCMMSNVHT